MLNRLSRVIVGIIFIIGLPLWTVVHLIVWITTGRPVLFKLIDWMLDYGMD